MNFSLYWNVLRKRLVFFRLFKAMIANLITWKEMTERIQVELLVYQ